MFCELKYSSATADHLIVHNNPSDVLLASAYTPTTIVHFVTKWLNSHLVGVYGEYGLVVGDGGPLPRVQLVLQPVRRRGLHALARVKHVRVPVYLSHRGRKYVYCDRQHIVWH